MPGLGAGSGLALDYKAAYCTLTHCLRAGTPERSAEGARMDR
jgi:hypothetical protein